MSDTPRTDEAFAVQGELTFQRKEYVMADFARQLERKLVKLERENAALRNEIARLNNQTNWVCSCGGTDCAGQKENAALRAALDCIAGNCGERSPVTLTEAQEEARDALAFSKETQL